MLDNGYHGITELQLVYNLSVKIIALVAEGNLSASVIQLKEQLLNLRVNVLTNFDKNFEMLATIKLVDNESKHV